jgi:hypothetical protein
VNTDDDPEPGRTLPLTAKASVVTGVWLLVVLVAALWPLVGRLLNRPAA